MESCVTCTRLRGAHRSAHAHSPHQTNSPRNTLTHKQVGKHDEVKDKESGGADHDGEANRHARPVAPLMFHHRCIGQLAGALCRPA